MNPSTQQPPSNQQYYELTTFPAPNNGQPQPLPNQYNQISPPERFYHNNYPNIELSYHEMHLAGLRDWWRPILGIIILIALTVIVVPIVLIIVFVFLYSAMGWSFGGSINDLTPGLLAYADLVLASAIPITWMLTQKLHAIYPRWLDSVQAKIRWNWLFVCAGYSVVALIAAFIVTLIFAPSDDMEDDATDFFPSKSSKSIAGFVFVVIFFTPLQAAGEEYAFRGYLTQAVGGFFRNRWVATLVPAFLFALAHGLDQTFPEFLDRFAFGVVSGLLTIMTGGLEAGIAMHTLNNVFAFLLVLIFGDITSAMQTSEEGSDWWRVPATAAQSLVYYYLVLRAADKMGIQKTVKPDALEEPRPMGQLVYV